MNPPMGRQLTSTSLEIVSHRALVPFRPQYLRSRFNPHVCPLAVTQVLEFVTHRTPFPTTGIIRDLRPHFIGRTDIRTNQQKTARFPTDFEEKERFI